MHCTLPVLKQLAASISLPVTRRLINRCSGLTMNVVNPVEFVLEASNDDPSLE